MLSKPVSCMRGLTLVHDICHRTYHSQSNFLSICLSNDSLGCIMNAGFDQVLSSIIGAGFDQVQSSDGLSACWKSEMLPLQLILGAASGAWDIRGMHCQNQLIWSSKFPRF